MSSDPRTLRVYDAEAARYARLTAAEAKNPHLRAFIARLRPGAHVLDLGCGPGVAAALMRDAGLEVDAVDASPGMAEEAARAYGLQVRIATFDEIAGQAIYDGIWAAFSLLHAPRASLPRHLAALHRAARPGAPFVIAMKEGDGEARDSLGRLYTYWREPALRAALEAAGFVHEATARGTATGLDGTAAPYMVLTAHA